MSMGIAGNAYADEFKLTPSLAVKEEYNDNILYSRQTHRKILSPPYRRGLR